MAEHKVFVGSLSYNATDDDLKGLFEQFGYVKNIHIPLDRDTQRPRGFAFVEFNSADEMAAAIEGGDGKEIDGRQIAVKKANERGGGGGGFGGGRGGGGGGGRW